MNDGGDGGASGRRDCKIEKLSLSSVGVGVGFKKEDSRSMADEYLPLATDLFTDLFCHSVKEIVGCVWGGGRASIGGGNIGYSSDELSDSIRIAEALLEEAPPGVEGAE